MNTSTRVGAYLVGLAVVFLAALGVGSAVGPVGLAGGQPQQPAQTGVGHDGMDMDGDVDG